MNKNSTDDSTQPLATVAYTTPFRVSDQDEFIRMIDDIDDISLAEEVIEGNQMVRLFAESGRWPNGPTGLADLISPSMVEGEVAVSIENVIGSRQGSEISLTAIEHTGRTMVSDLKDTIEDLKDAARSTT